MISESRASPPCASADTASEARGIDAPSTARTPPPAAPQAGGLCSTALDLVSWTQAVFGGRLLARAKVDGQWKLLCPVHNIERLAHAGYAA